VNKEAIVSVTFSHIGAALALTAAFVANTSLAAEPDRFGIFVSTLDGRNVRCILSDPNREMNHARVSPDKKWITFTRYNKHGWFSSIAKEDGGNYLETEIMLARIDGSELQSLVSPRKDKVAANGYWTEDGKAILFVSNDNPAHQGQISRVDLATREITRIVVPGGLWAADPHQVGRQLAMSVFDPKQKQSSIWLADIDAGKVRQITFPSQAGIDLSVNIPLGDYDPKISPDGFSVVAMRNMGKDNWHVVVVDLGTGQERDISPDKSVDGVPEWSGDGRKLIFWYVDIKELKKSGLYTMTPDGRGRTRIPLPGGYFYTMPAFFPGEGSGDEARILFSAEKTPFL
jgi:Tol biopolymer transport system component